MWDEIINLAVGNGLWAVLFCILFVYQIKSSKIRETRYQDTVKTLSVSLLSVKGLEAQAEEIKKSLDKIERRDRKRKEERSAAAGGEASKELLKMREGAAV